MNIERLDAMLKWIVEKIYHYSTALTSWSWTWLYGKRKVIPSKAKGILRMDQTRINYYKSLISYDKRDNIVEQIIKEKMNRGNKRRHKDS
jgi:hypothetical protein